MAKADRLRLSPLQAVTLQRLADGWRLEYRNMVTLIWYDAAGTPKGGSDSRPVQGLWRRELIKIGPRAPDMKMDLRCFSMTDAGRAALEQYRAR